MPAAADANRHPFWPTPLPDMAETALIVRVPEAEALVGGLRARHDASARAGVPAHITILVPFMPPEAIDSAVLADLRQALGRTSAFAFSLSHVGLFAATAYLAPEPAEPFVRLTESVVRCYPAYPPFRGEHPAIIPHLTVANGDSLEARHVAATLRKIMTANGPVECVCSTVEILENSSGSWRPMASIALPQRQVVE
jgi:2'-5' RNA ligase